MGVRPARARVRVQLRPLRRRLAARPGSATSSATSSAARRRAAARRLGSLEKKTEENPKDAKAWRELATALEQKDEPDEAIVALTRYTELRPKDEDAARRSSAGSTSAARTTSRSSTSRRRRRRTALQPGTTFKPAAGSPLAQALQDPIAAGDRDLDERPTHERRVREVHRHAGKAVGVYKQLVALNPKDATNQYRLAQVAQSAGNNAEAIAAYTAFLKLAPNDSLAPAAKKALKELKARHLHGVGLDRWLDSAAVPARRAPTPGKMNFDIKTEPLSDHAFVVSLAGEVDLYVAPELKQQLLEVDRARRDAGRSST